MYLSINILIQHFCFILALHSAEALALITGAFKSNLKLNEFEYTYICMYVDIKSLKYVCVKIAKSASYSDFLFWIYLILIILKN